MIVHSNCRENAFALHKNCAFTCHYKVINLKMVVIRRSQTRWEGNAQTMKDHHFC